MPSHRYNLTIAAMIKNEAPYLAEWIEFHLQTGVEHFYLIDNESTDNTADVLDPYIRRNLITVTSTPTRGFQCQELTALLPQLREQTRWVAFIDADEFLFCPDGAQVPRRLDTLLAQYAQIKPIAGFVVHWRLFGENGQMRYKDRPVIERFTECAPAPSRFTKMVVMPQRMDRIDNVHLTLQRHALIDERGRTHTRRYHDSHATDNLLRINHYAIKSIEEFTARTRRGRAGGEGKHTHWDIWERYWCHRGAGAQCHLAQRYLPTIKERLGIST